MRRKERNTRLDNELVRAKPKKWKTKDKEKIRKGRERK